MRRIQSFFIILIFTGFCLSCKTGPDYHYQSDELIEKDVAYYCVVQNGTVENLENITVSDGSNVVFSFDDDGFITLKIKPLNKDKKVMVKNCYVKFESSIPVEYYFRGEYSSKSGVYSLENMKGENTTSLDEAFAFNNKSAYSYIYMRLGCKKNTKVYLDSFYFD